MISPLVVSCLGFLALIQTPIQTPATVPPQATFSLKFVPTEGSVLIYKVTGSMEVQNETSRLDSKITHKVIKVDPDGTYSLQSDTLEGKVLIGGQELPLQKSSTLTIYKPGGEVISVAGAQTDTTLMRSENLTMLKRPDGPVKVGDTWALAMKADPVSKSPSIQGTFTFDGEEAVGTYQTLKIESKVNEGETSNPGSVIASFWINKVDGSLVKWDCQYTMVTFPGATSPLSGTLSMLRVDK